MSSKQKIRKHFVELRSQIKTEYCEEAMMRAAKHFVKMDLFLASKNIACYLPFRNEFNTASIIEMIWQSQKHCYLPILTDEKKLIFACYQYGDALIRNRYQILEPKNNKREINPKDLDIVITPLVAFDVEGTRLGTGGGFYDRTFAFLHEASDGNRAQLLQPHMIGLAYALQQVKDPLPRDPWDITLEAVITEKNIIWTKET